MQIHLDHFQFDVAHIDAPNPEPGQPPLHIRVLVFADQRSGLQIHVPLQEDAWNDLKLKAENNSKIEIAQALPDLKVPGQ